MKEVASLIAVNKDGEILLHLRDDIDTIQFPGQWGLPGGEVEKGESPEEAIAREIKEEMEIDIAGYFKFRTYEREIWIEHVYFMVLDLDLMETACNEGQRFDYFNKEEIMEMDLAFYHNETFKDFFEKFPDFFCDF